MGVISAYLRLCCCKVSTFELVLARIVETFGLFGIFFGDALGSLGLPPLELHIERYFCLWEFSEFIEFTL